jgi:hypothetical protein
VVGGWEINCYTKLFLILGIDISSVLYDNKSMIQKHEIVSGKYEELLEYFSHVQKEYKGKNTECFDMPSMTIQEQFGEIFDNQNPFGSISYCRVKEHKKDPMVEVITTFILIEDVFDATLRRNRT